MRNMKIILSKELRSYFDTPTAYIFIVIFLLLTGTYFVSNLFLDNVSSLGSLFVVAPVIFMFFAPAITMRLISEEKKTGTFEILGTKPLKTGHIVLGKFLASWFLMLFALVPTLVYFFSVTFLGSLDFGPLLGGYLGLFLMGGAFAAIGILGSSLSHNQIVSFIISFVILLVLFTIDRILIYVPAPLVPFIEFLSSNHHFSSMARGVIDSRDILYYLSLIVTGLLAATVFSDVETVRSGWKLREFSWTQQIPRLGLVLVIIIFANLLSVSLFTRIDLTRDKVYTLTPTSKEMLSSLDDNFLVKAYFTPNLPPPYHNHRQIVQEMLEEYRALAPGTFHYEFINPLTDPEIERQAVQEGMAPVQVKVIKNDKFQTDKAYVGFAFSYIDKAERVPVVQSLDQLEYYVTGSMKKLITPQMKKVGVLSGHGEIPLAKLTRLQEALSKQYAVTSVSVKGGKDIPADITVLLVAAPQAGFQEKEKFALDQYIMRGGRVAFLINNMAVDRQTNLATPLAHNLDDLFEAYGWIVHTNLVMDARCVNMTVEWDSTEALAPTEVAYPFYPVASDFNPTSVIVKNLASIPFTFVSSIDTRLAEIRGVKATTLVSSSTQSRKAEGMELSVDPKQNFDLGAFNDQRLPFAAAIEGSFTTMYAKRHGESDLMSSILKSPSTRLAIVADGDFISDENVRSNDNVAFVANLVDWLVDDVSMTSIRSRDLTPKPLAEVSEATKSAYKYVNFLVPPGIVVVIGIMRVAMKAARRKIHKNSF